MNLSAKVESPSDFKENQLLTPKVMKQSLSPNYYSTSNNNNLGVFISPFKSE